jgi:diketogulonate reductase-like aldo/keto reductase
MARQVTIQANGAAIPAIGFGTWPLKGAECQAAVEAALACGYRHVDTAAMYGNEAQVGAALKASGVPRAQVFVTTKVWHEHLDEGPFLRSAEASLKALGLAQVDLLLIHWPNPKIPLRNTMRALGRLRAAGLTRHAGVSNFPVALLHEAMRCADFPLVTNQVEYHPWLSQAALMPTCKANGLALTAYMPLGRGALLADPVVVALAAAKGATPAQVILAWHRQQGVIAVPKSAHAERIAENLASLDVSLTPDEMRRLHGLARRDGRQLNPAFAPRWDAA